MPELPEVETVVRGLRAEVVGRRLADFATRQPKAINLPVEAFAARVRQPITGVDRVGKSAVLRLDGDRLWLHRGLSGQVLFDAAGTPPPPQPSIITFTFADGARLRLERLFMGHAHLLTEEQSAARMAELGPDALAPEVCVEWLRRVAAAKPTLGVKALLMDQALLAGLGNVYSDEALHRAGLHPARKLGSLTAAELARLHQAIAGTLAEAIAAGGDESYTDIYGRPGRYRTRVHGHAACAGCGGPIAKQALGGRTAYFCERCQR